MVLLPDERNGKNYTELAEVSTLGVSFYTVFRKKNTHVSHVIDNKEY